MIFPSCFPMIFFMPLSCLPGSLFRGETVAFCLENLENFVFPKSSFGSPNCPALAAYSSKQWGVGQNDAPSKVYLQFTQFVWGKRNKHLFFWKKLLQTSWILQVSKYPLLSVLMAPWVNSKISSVEADSKKFQKKTLFGVMTVGANPYHVELPRWFENKNDKSLFKIRIGHCIEIYLYIQMSTQIFSDFPKHLSVFHLAIARADIQHRERLNSYWPSLTTTLLCLPAQYARLIAGRYTRLMR